MAVCHGNKHWRNSEPVLIGACSEGHLGPRALYRGSWLLLGRLPGSLTGENPPCSHLSPQSPLFLQRAFFSPALDQRTVDVEKQTEHTVCSEPPRRFPGLGFHQQKPASWKMLSSPSLLSLRESLLPLGGSPSQCIVMSNAPAAPAVIKINRLSREQWRLH